MSESGRRDVFDLLSSRIEGDLFYRTAILQSHKSDFHHD